MSIAARPFFREQGSGVGVVCLHSNASTSSQWRQLGELLAPRFHVIALDSYGAGKSPPWPGGAPLLLDDEAALAGSALQHAGESFHLVGHSYGAAIALKLATQMPARVRSVTIYEPTLFYLVNAGDPLRSPAEGIWRAASDAAEAVARGDHAAAAERFIDFWMGSGSWVTMPAARQTAVAAAMGDVGYWRDALFSEAIRRAELAALNMPVLLMHGERSPESALSVVRELTGMLRNVTLAPQPGLGHMGPITHPAQVNAQIAAFLERG